MRRPAFFLKSHMGTDRLWLYLYVTCCSFQNSGWLHFYPNNEESPCEAGCLRLAGSRNCLDEGLCVLDGVVPLLYQAHADKTSLPVDVSDLSSCWLFFLRNLEDSVGMGISLVSSLILLPSQWFVWTGCLSWPWVLVSSWDRNLWDPSVLLCDSSHTFLTFLSSHVQDLHWSWLFDI